MFGKLYATESNTFVDLVIDAHALLCRKDHSIHIHYLVLENSGFSILDTMTYR
jgi:hypothetical protein